MRAPDEVGAQLMIGDQISKAVKALHITGEQILKFFAIMRQVNVLRAAHVL